MAWNKTCLCYLGITSLVADVMYGRYKCKVGTVQAVGYRYVSSLKSTLIEELLNGRFQPYCLFKVSIDWSVDNFYCNYQLYSIYQWLCINCGPRSCFGILKYLHLTLIYSLLSLSWILAVPKNLLLWPWKILTKNMIIFESWK